MPRRKKFNKSLLCPLCGKQKYNLPLPLQNCFTCHLPVESCILLCKYKFHFKCLQGYTSTWCPICGNMLLDHVINYLNNNANYQEVMSYLDMGVFMKPKFEKVREGPFYYPWDPHGSSGDCYYKTNIRLN